MKLNIDANLKEFLIIFRLREMELVDEEVSLVLQEQLGISEEDANFAIEIYSKYESKIKNYINKNIEINNLEQFKEILDKEIKTAEEKKQLQRGDN